MDPSYGYWHLAPRAVRYPERKTMKPRFRALFRASGLNRNALQSTDTRGHRTPQEGTRVRRHADGGAVRCGRQAGISAIYVKIPHGQEQARDQRTHVVLRDGATRIERRVYRADHRPDAPNGGGNSPGRPYKVPGARWRQVAIAISTDKVKS